MQNLNRIWQIVNAAGVVRDIAQQSKTYHFAVETPLTFYLRTESAAVRISRWHNPFIKMTTRLQGAFGWRLLAEQDEAGVYVAAKRRVIVGSLSSAAFDIYLPFDTHVILKLHTCDLVISGADGEFHLPASEDQPPLLLNRGDF